MVAPLRLTPLLVLVCACAGPAAVREAPQPWFVGTFAGISIMEYDGERIELGTGQVEVRADGTFSLRFKWSGTEFSGGLDWDAAGPWELQSPPVGDGGDPAEVHLGLRQGARLNASIPFGAPGVALVSRDEVLVGFGPCMSFTLPRKQ